MTIAASSAADLTQASLTNPAQNVANRAILFANSLRMSHALVTVNNLNGGNQRRANIQLENYGILQYIDAIVTATITNNGAAALVPSQNFPYGLIESVKTNFYSPQHRLSLTGTELWYRNSIRSAKISYASNAFGVGAPNGGHFALPTSATLGAIAAGDSATVQLYVRIPVSMSLATTMGAVAMQGITGQAYCEITLAGNSPDGLYTDLFPGGDYSITNGSVQLTQGYLQPQNNNIPFPALDLSTVYELAGNQPSNSNLAVGSPKYVDLPNARTVHGIYVAFANGSGSTAGGYHFGSDLQSLRVRASGNTYLNTDPVALWNMRQRETLGADFLPGYYFSDYARTPITSNYLGQFQIELVPASLGANPSVNPMYESTYQVGTQLPGL